MPKTSGHTLRRSGGIYAWVLAVMDEVVNAARLALRVQRFCAVCASTPGSQSEEAQPEGAVSVSVIACWRRARAGRVFQRRAR